MQRKLDVELLPHWGDRPISSITRADVKALLREKARVSPIAANRLLALVTRFLPGRSTRKLSGPLPRCGCHAMAEQERERALTADEIRTVWAAFDQLGYPFGDSSSCCSSPGSAAAKSPACGGPRSTATAGPYRSPRQGDGWAPGPAVVACAGNPGCAPA